MAKKENQPAVGDHEDCTYPYPNWQEVQPAFGTILAKLRGEDVEVACLVHCGYAAAGFGLSMAFPHTPSPEPHVHESAPPLGAAEGEAAIEALASWDGKSRQAFNWLQIAMFIGDLLLKWLKNR